MNWKPIKTEKAYNKALEDVYHLMCKGEENVSEKESDKIGELQKAIQTYETIHYPFPMPKTHSDMG